MNDQCPKNATTIPTFMNNDGFQTVVNKKKSGKTCSIVVKTTWQPINQNVRFDPKSHGNPQKANDGLQHPSSASNIHTSNPYDALDDMENDEEVEVVYDETTHLFGNNIMRAIYTALNASKT
ncbi:hypothetical protein Tco_1161873 [Tanacetum coccineum]